MPEEVPVGGWVELPAFKEANRQHDQELWQESIEKYKLVLSQLPRREKTWRESCFIMQSTCFNNLVCFFGRALELGVTVSTEAAVRASLEQSQQWRRQQKPKDIVLHILDLPKATAR